MAQVVLRLRKCHAVTRESITYKVKPGLFKFVDLYPNQFCLDNLFDERERFLQTEPHKEVLEQDFFFVFVIYDSNEDVNKDIARFTIPITVNGVNNLDCRVTTGGTVEELNRK